MSLEFQQSNFADDSDQLTNMFFPFTPGTQFTYEGVSNAGKGLTEHQVIFTVTDLVRTIDGVNTVVVWDRDLSHGTLQEAELSFFAQDKDGNVWNLGEYPELYKNGNFTGAPSTWISGETDAQGGVHMLADPQTGTTPYVQGIVPSIAFYDVAKVTGTGKSLSVAGESYTNVLVTREWNPHDPSAKQDKFYAPDVGIVKITAVNDPEGETLNLIDFKHLSPEELATARQEAIKLEDHAYHINQVYIEADPAGRFDHGTNGSEGKTIVMGPGNDHATGGPGDDTFIFGGILGDKVKQVAVINDYHREDGDVISLRKGAASIAHDKLVNGVWQITLKGDGDVINLPGVVDENHNGHILDDVFIV
jgi:hypothetical protein